MAVGLVVVSHSRGLAEAAVDLAIQMAPHTPNLRIAAGMPDGTLGTDATAIVAAVAQVDQGEGVAIIADMGSAVLSSELAIELCGESRTIRLLAAPFVEGLVAAAVRASAGATLDEIEAEACAALLPKQTAAVTDSSRGPWPGVTHDVVLSHEHGLHAALLAQVARDFDAKVLVSAGTLGPVAATSAVGWAMLNARCGDTVRLLGNGPQAREAVEALAAHLRTT